MGAVSKVRSLFVPALEFRVEEFKRFFFVFVSGLAVKIGAEGFGLWV